MFNSEQLISILNSSIGLFSAFIISTFVYFNYGNDYSVFFLGYYSIFALSVAVYMNSHYSVISHKPTLLNFIELIKFGGGYFFLISCFIPSLMISLYLFYSPDYLDSFSKEILLIIFFATFLYSIFSFLNSRIFLTYDITIYNKLSFVNKFLSMVTILVLSFYLDFSSFLMSFILVNLLFSICLLVFYIFGNRKLHPAKSFQKSDRFFSLKLNLITFSYFMVNKLILVFLPNIDFDGNKLVIAYATMILSSIVNILSSSRSYIVPELTKSWKEDQKIFFDKRDLIISQFKFIGMIYIFSVTLLLMLIYILFQVDAFQVDRITLNFILLSILIYYCELNSSSATVMLNASGRVIYWKWSLFTGFLYLIILYIVSLSYNITPFIMILIQFSSMAIYQYWKWPILLISYSNNK